MGWMLDGMEAASHMLSDASPAGARVIPKGKGQSLQRSRAND
jgi:hypothetical protein